MASEAILNKLPLPAKVYGDIHGQFRDMLLFLHCYGFPSRDGPHFIFNGDWVDRGKHQLEVICLVYALKLALPGKVWLNRGNHEDIAINRHQKTKGFEYHCCQRLGADLGKRVFEAFAWSYGYLPLASLLADNILIVHGGIGDGDWQLSSMRDLERPIDRTLSSKIVYNLLWSDPIDEDQKDSFGVHSSPRDKHRNFLTRFGADVTKSFCDRNALGMIIRSHQSARCGDGYEVMHDEHLIRCFSARDYCECMANDGSILSIKLAQDKVLVTPQVLKSVVKRGLRVAPEREPTSPSPR